MTIELTDWAADILRQDLVDSPDSDNLGELSSRISDELAALERLDDLVRALTSDRRRGNT